MESGVLVDLEPFFTANCCTLHLNTCEGFGELPLVLKWSSKIKTFQRIIPLSSTRLLNVHVFKVNDHIWESKQYILETHDL